MKECVNCSHRDIVINDDSFCNSCLDFSYYIPINKKIECREFAGWEIVKMISEGKIKNGQNIIGHNSKLEDIHIILKVNPISEISLLDEGKTVEYGISYLFMPKDILCFTIL
jgi:hypothetical protein